MRCFCCNRQDASVYDRETERDYCTKCIEEIGTITSLQTDKNIHELLYGVKEKDDDDTHAMP